MAAPEALTEVLIEAYQRACYPTYFDPERGDLQMATLVRERITSVNFAPYWTDMFVGFRGNYGNPAGVFARNVFRAAETQGEPKLLAIVATELAGSFGEAVLRAEFDTPLLEGSQSSSPLAQFLIERGAILAGSSYIRPPMISPAWIGLAHTLTSTDAVRHDQLLGEITLEYNRADHDSKQAMEEDGWTGGYGIFDRDHQIKVVLARTLARHFPAIVVSQLREPARPSS